ARGPKTRLGNAPQGGGRFPLAPAFASAAGYPRVRHMDAKTPDAKTAAGHGQNTKSAELKVGDKNYQFPVYEGTIGPDVIDISKLYNQAGVFTYDPGFTSTGSCESKITYIDGDEGILLYRGYPIEQLAENGDFLETCYLLLYGELPTSAQ